MAEFLLRMKPEFALEVRDLLADVEETGAGGFGEQAGEFKASLTAAIEHAHDHEEEFVEWFEDAESLEPLAKILDMVAEMEEL